MTVVTLTTDFGTRDPWVGIMKGVLATRAPEARVIDVTHAIPPQDVLAGAIVLGQAAPWFPPGTVHVAVVDPGVGGPRRPLCVETTRGCLVGPDNGVLSFAAPTADTRRVVHVIDERHLLSPRSATFHGRDVFAPVAAALATGTPAAALGPEVTDMHRLELPAPVTSATGVRGEVIWVDHFGNLVTNVPERLLATFPPARVSIRIRQVCVRGLATSYAEAAPGEPLAVVNSWGLLEVAVRDGSAATLLGGGRGDPVVIERT